MSEKISVLIPMFNREQFIEEAINSISNQTYKDLEILVYDDGSDDKSIEIIEKLMKKDNRIKLIKGIKNKGVGHARNELLNACDTNYACWQDSDDLAHPEKIELQYKERSKYKGSPLIFTKWVWLYQMGKQWRERLKNSDSLGFATVMFRVEKNILFDPLKKLGGEDWHWLKRMQKLYSQIEIEPVLYYVRFHEDRIGSWKRKTRFNDDFPKDVIKNSNYKEIIEYYKKHYE